jgi:hypothetical protein
LGIVTYVLVTVVGPPVPGLLANLKQTCKVK